MRRGFFRTLTAAAALAAAAALGLAAPAAAEVPDDYPEELLAFLGSVSPESKRRIDAWWDRMPGYFKESLMDEPFEEWREVIYCDYLGFRAGSPEGAQCVEMRNETWQRNASQWNADGTYRGPSEACLARNETDRFGRLICVTREEQARVQDYWDRMPRDAKLDQFSEPGRFWQELQFCYEEVGFEVGTPQYDECVANYDPDAPMN